MEMRISNRIRTDVQSIENQHTMITLAEISMVIEEYHRINVGNLRKIDWEEYRSRSMIDQDGCSDLDPMMNRIHYCSNDWF